MTRPPWEVADVIHRAGSRFIERYRESLTWAQIKVLTAIARAAPPRWAGIAINAFAAAIKPSPITPAATGIAR